MSDIDPFAGCGFFCLIWLNSLDAWKTTALVLLSVVAIGILWKTLWGRKQIVLVSSILLIMHLGSSAYVNWLMP